jgi:hypothetical protein
MTEAKYKSPVGIYMMAAYAYYVDAEPILQDHEFDELAVYLLENYDKYKTHPHCPTEDDLRAGTYLGEYPTIVQGALMIYRDRP